MPRRNGRATRIQALEHILIQLPRPMSVRVRQRRTLCRAVNPELLKPTFGARQTLLDLTQRLGSPKLTEDHRHELRPRTEALRAPIRPVQVNDLLELRTRNKLEYLMENATESLHRRAPPCLELRQPDSTGTRRYFTLLASMLFWTRVIRQEPGKRQSPADQSIKRRKDEPQNRTFASCLSEAFGEERFVFAEPFHIPRLPRKSRSGANLYLSWS